MQIPISVWRAVKEDEQRTVRILPLVTAVVSVWRSGAYAYSNLPCVQTFGCLDPNALVFGRVVV